MPPLPLPAAPTVPSLPAISLPPVVTAAHPCPGARRRSGARARRVAVGCLVNKARTAAGLRGFAWSRSLAAPRPATRATWRAAATSPTGARAARRRPRRARAAGFRGRNVGEAIAYGCGSLSTPASIVRSWMDSPPHRAILLSVAAAWGSASPAARPLAAVAAGATYVLDAG